MKLTDKQSEFLKFLRKEKKPKNATQMDRILKKAEIFSTRTINSLLSRKIITPSYPRGFVLTNLGRTIKIR